MSQHDCEIHTTSQTPNRRYKNPHDTQPKKYSKIKKKRQLNKTNDQISLNESGIEKKTESFLLSDDNSFIIQQTPRDDFQIHTNNNQCQIKNNESFPLSEQMKLLLLGKSQNFQIPLNSSNEIKSPQNTNLKGSFRLNLHPVQSERSQFDKIIKQRDVIIEQLQQRNCQLEFELQDAKTSLKVQQQEEQIKIDKIHQDYKEASEQLKQHYERQYFEMTSKLQQEIDYFQVENQQLSLQIKTSVVSSCKEDQKSFYEQMINQLKEQFSQQFSTMVQNFEKLRNEKTTLEQQLQEKSNKLLEFETKALLLKDNLCLNSSDQKQRSRENIQTLKHLTWNQRPKVQQQQAKSNKQNKTKHQRYASAQMDDSVVLQEQQFNCNFTLEVNPPNIDSISDFKEKVTEASIQIPQGKFQSFKNNQKENICKNESSQIKKDYDFKETRKEYFVRDSVDELGSFFNHSIKDMSKFITKTKKIW